MISFFLIVVSKTIHLLRSFKGYDPHEIGRCIDSEVKICKPEFPIWKIFTNWLYETTLMRFVFTWLPCWSKKHHYSGVYRGSKFMHFDKSCAKMSQNHTSNLDKVFLNVPPSSDFGLEARILQIGWFYRPKWKKVEKSASKNKHPIKLRFLIWRLQSANPEKKVIPENQGFGSCPLSYNLWRNFLSRNKSIWFIQPGFHIYFSRIHLLLYYI